MHGMEHGDYAYGMWPVVFFNIMLILFFTLSFVKPKKRYEWRSMGVFIGFIAALFTEMYGFPLTIYLLTGWLGSHYPVAQPFTHSAGHLLLVAFRLSDSAFAMSVLHIVTNGMILFGFYIIYRGWLLIHEAEENQLVTHGIYAYIRHPQYVGMFLITVAFLIQWPALTTLIMWPILMLAYYKLCAREEAQLEQMFGDEFRAYRARVPAFIPGFRMLDVKPARQF